MNKSDLLKDSMKTGLDGLLSPTKKSTQKEQQVSSAAEKKRSCGTLQLRHRQEHPYPHEIPCH